MEIRRNTSLTDIEIEELLVIQNKRLPDNLYTEFDEFKRRLSNYRDPEYITLHDEDDTILGFVILRSIGVDNHRYGILIVDDVAAGNTYGKQIIDAAKESNDNLYGWVYDGDHRKTKDGSKYKSPLTYYITQGFKIDKPKKVHPSVEEDGKIKRIKWEKN